MKMIWVKTKRERRIEDLIALVKATKDLLTQADLLAAEVDKLTDLSCRERLSFNNILNKIYKKKVDYEKLLNDYR